LALALRSGHSDFASRLFVDRQVEAYAFSHFCAVQDEPEALRHMLDTGPGEDLGYLCSWAVQTNAAGSLRVLLEYGARITQRSVLVAARDNRMDVLELAMKQGAVPWAKLPSVAAYAGHVRFLMRAFEAGCPVWQTAEDGRPLSQTLPWIGPWTPVWELSPMTDGIFQRKRPDSELVTFDSGDCQRWDWCLTVPSDMLRSGPVLLLAAQKGSPLTPCMEQMLEDVRRRALALAGCFHRAAWLSRGNGAAERKWDSMGRVPIAIVQTIATIARLSIVAVDDIE
jgi:hypothetical protein